MKRAPYDLADHFPASTSPCSRCSNLLANGAPCVEDCQACQANANVAFHLWLERAEEERTKWLQLYKLWLAVLRVSRWIGEPDTTAIVQRIEAAADRPLHADDKDKTTDPVWGE